MERGERHVAREKEHRALAWDIMGDLRGTKEQRRRKNMPEVNGRDRRQDGREFGARTESRICLVFSCFSWGYKKRRPTTGERPCSCMNWGEEEEEVA